MNLSDVPQSISFGKKILFIPSFKEMGIPISGLGFAQLEDKYDDLNIRLSGGIWINRGDKLLSYSFNSFDTKKPSFFQKLFKGDYPTIRKTWVIESPVNGLLIGTREEKTIRYTNGGIRYENSEENILPIILIPNDEPFPINNYLYQYDGIASWLSYYFYFLPVRIQNSGVFVQRLKDWIENEENSYYADTYLKYLGILRNRDASQYRNYSIREITKNDEQIIKNIQTIRGKYIDLRDKLVHISNEFSESI